MKQCHACGQKLPLKVGDVVQFIHTGTRERVQGLISSVAPTGGYAWVVSFKDGRTMTHPINGMTRLHGYYRITEREPLA